MSENGQRNKKADTSRRHLLALLFGAALFASPASTLLGLDGAALAKDGGKGSDGGGSGSGSDDSGGSDSDNSGKGSGGDDGDDDGGGHGKDQRRSVERYLDLVKSRGRIAKFSDDGRTIDVRYADGWRETVGPGRYALYDDDGRCVVDRPARRSDFARLRAALK